MKEKWFLYHNKSPIKSHIHLNESVIFNNTKRQRFSLRQGKTDDKNGKRVLQYCSKTSWVATLRVFNTNHEQPRIKPTSFPGSLSYPYGRVGENPGNEVGIKPVSPTNRVVTDCEKLLQTVESSSIFFLQQNLKRCALYRPKANLFCSRLRKYRVWRDFRVISSNQKSVFTQLATTWFWFISRQV